MQVSDVFFLPSHREGLCLSIIEAMNFGLPIVTSNVRGCQDLVEDGKNGFTADKNDYMRYADIFKKLINDAELKRQLGKNSKEMAPIYDIENVKKQLEEIYKVI